MRLLKDVLETKSSRRDAGKLRAAQAKNSFLLCRGNMHAEQFSGEPEIDDAPVSVGKTIVNTPTTSG
jgi:transcriptional regulator of met regulon